MSQLITQYTATQSSGEVTGTTNGAAISLQNCFSFSAACNVTVDTPIPKTFLSGVAALLAVQDITYTAVVRGTDGNSITITYTGGATAGAEVVTVVGTAITIQIQSGVSTATEVGTAYNLVAAATALATATITGTAGNAQVTATVAPLATGVNSAVDVTADTITISAHGYTTGLKVRFTTDGTLPAGISLATDYFIIVLTSSTFQIATSLANALAGTPVNITGQGSSGATNTITATAIAGATIGLYKSNDGTNWTIEGSTQAVTVSALLWFEKVNPSALFYRLQYVLTAGQLISSSLIVIKGYN